MKKKSLILILVAISMMAGCFSRGSSPAKNTESGDVMAKTRDGFRVTVAVAVQYTGPSRRKKFSGKVSPELEQAVKGAVSELGFEEMFSGGKAVNYVRNTVQAFMEQKKLHVAGSPAVVFRLSGGQVERYVKQRARLTEKKFIILGMDGIDWAVINPLIEQGRLPNVERIIKEGASGKLMSFTPTLSPLIWTTIATGRLPEEHGILDFVRVDEEGKPTLMNSTHRRVPTLWHIAGWAGLKVGVAGWLASWPAERINGAMVTDRFSDQLVRRRDDPAKFSQGKTWPPELYAKLEPVKQQTRRELTGILPAFIDTSSRIVNPEFVDEFENKTHRIFTLNSSVSNFVTIRNAGLRMLENERPDLLALYFESTDTIAHQFMEFAPPRRPDVTDAQAAAFGDTVNGIYELMDETIGMYLDAAGGAYNVIVISDHGFKTGDQRPRESGHIEGPAAAEWHRLAGVILAIGPDIRPGEEVSGASVKDITRTLLYGLGVPAARDMCGTPIMGLFAENPAPTRELASYDWLWRATADPIAKAVNHKHERAELERLKQLGYIGNAGAPGSAHKNHADDNEHGALGESERYNLGYRYLKEGQYGKAIELFQKDLKQHPNAPQLLAGIGNAYMESGRYADALAAFNRALELQPNLAAHYLNMGALHIKMKDYARAEQFLKKALALDNGIAEAHNNLGLAAYHSGRSEQAVSYYEKSLKLDGNVPGTHLNLGIACWDLQDFACAAAGLGQAFSLDRKFMQSPNLVLAAGISNFHIGKYDAAKDYLEMALASDNRILKAHYHLGLIAEIAGDNQTAVLEWKKELKLNPGDRQTMARLKKSGVAIAR